VMAGLNGSLVAGMGEARMRNDTLNMVGADVVMQVLSAVNPVGNKDPCTLTRCGVVNLQISGGIAQTNQGIALVTDKMQVTSSGRIDLREERIDLDIRPRATGGVGVGLGTLVQAVKVTGPLSDPGVGIDKAGAVRTLGTIGAAFATGGASLFAQGARNRAEGAGDPCQTARTWHVKG
jgi:AsmA family protein